MTRLETHHFKGEVDGPKLLVFGAVHGNEHCGPKGIRMCLDQINSGELKSKRAA
jgi:predicted deacylase